MPIGSTGVWVNWISPAMELNSEVTSIVAVGIKDGVEVDLAEYVFYQVDDNIAFTGNTTLISSVLTGPIMPTSNYIRLVYSKLFAQVDVDHVVNDASRGSALYNIGAHPEITDDTELVSIDINFAASIVEPPPLPLPPPAQDPDDPIIPPGSITLPETWPLTLARACERSRLRYDGDSALLSDDLLDDMTLEAQRMIVEQLRWPLLKTTLTHGSLASFEHTVIYIKVGDEIYEPPIYPTGVDLTDITVDVEVYYLPNEDYVFLPEALWQALCFLASALVLVQFENEKREIAYRKFAAERIASFKRQLNQLKLSNDTGTNSIYGITR